MTSDVPALVFAGPIRMEYFLLPDGTSHPGRLGGPALYAGAGARAWIRDGIGLISRVGSNFSARTIQEIRRYDLDCSGVRILAQHPPSLGFHYYESWEKHIDWDPVKYYSRHGLSCPQELLPYIPPAQSENSTHPYPDIAVRRDDIPPKFLQARAVCITPCHYQSQVTLSVAFRQSGAGTILLSPPVSLLLPSFRLQIREILHGIDILFVREANARAFLGDRYPDEAAISEHLAQWGPKIVLLQKEFQGVYAYDSETRRTCFVPFYPVEMKHPQSVGDSFCGGFLAQWRKAYDLLEAVLVGCVSASLSAEGLGALSALERNPGLAQARLTSLRRSLVK